MSSKRRIDDLNRHCSPHSLLVHAEGKGLIRVRCPFTARCIEAVGPISCGERVSVKRVKLAQDLRLVYEIRGRDYYYHAFAIEL